MMKLSAKPISSPGRADKYPPPLMRFLRSNVGSRSRGRSRSSPMFIRKKNTAIETQEPTSPKVTCMGQVRVRRSKRNPKTLKPKPKHKCRWIQNTLFCHHFYIKPKPSCFTTSWPKFCYMGFRRKSKIKEEFEPKFGNRSEDMEQESEEDEEEEKEEVDAAKVYASTTPITPPKNALLLTRCRSAPYRSSSLAFKFWGSPLENEETEQKQMMAQETSEDESPKSKRVSLSNQELKSDKESEEKIGLFKEFTGSLSSIREKMVKDGKFEEVSVDGNLRPLILTRCKSEPARTGEKLDPEIGFWKKRRLGFT